MSEESNGTVIPITDATPLMALQGGRPIKFTPERMEQIKNLVERGMSREEIAETIGVTLGSLQVTCSRMGISLRRPRLPDTSRTPLRAPSAPRQHQNGANLGIALAVQHRGRVLNLQLPQSLLGELALEAFFTDQSIDALITKMLTNALKEKANAHVQENRT